MTPPAAAVAEPLPRRRTSTRRAPVRHPRRVSGPTRPARPTRPAQSAAPARVARGRQQADAPGLALRAVEAYERVADSALLDRLVRGRVWIGLLAFGLIGIVAMQLIVLKLNTGIGTTLERAASLQRENAQLRIEAATGSGEGRIAPLAAATGMTFAPSGSVHFVASSPAADVARAASVLAQPIQPHESAPVGSEALAGGGEAEGSGAASPSASGAGSSSAGEAVASSEAASGSDESGSGGSSEASPPAESQSARAAASAGEPEASATAAGGVAAGR